MKLLIIIAPMIIFMAVVMAGMWFDNSKPIPMKNEEEQYEIES